MRRRRAGGRNRCRGGIERAAVRQLYGVLGALIVILLLTLPSGAPLRDPENGDIIGNTPFMDSLIFIITLIFLVAGICYGVGAGTVKSSTDVINGITKTFQAQGGLVFMLLVISQFIAYFNFSRMPQVLAGWMADLLERADVNEIVLLVGFILVIALLDIIMPGSLPKWAIFAPIFVPLFCQPGRRAPDGAGRLPRSAIRPSTSSPR